MHPLNPYLNNKPDFAKLASNHKAFAPLYVDPFSLSLDSAEHRSVQVTPSGYASIDFQSPDALRTLTCALLKQDWDLDVDLRDDRLVPTVCG
jgi:methyltransferase